MFLENVEFFDEVDVNGGASVGKRYEAHAILGPEQLSGVLLNLGKFDLTAHPVHSMPADYPAAARVARHLLELLGGVQAGRIEHGAWGTAT